VRKSLGQSGAACGWPNHWIPRLVEVCNGPVASRGLRSLESSTTETYESPTDLHRSQGR
jgi:hypothetical protein